MKDLPIEQETGTIELFNAPKNIVEKTKQLVESLNGMYNDADSDSYTAVFELPNKADLDEIRNELSLVEPPVSVETRPNSDRPSEEGDDSVTKYKLKDYARQGYKYYPGTYYLGISY